MAAVHVHVVDTPGGIRGGHPIANSSGEFVTCCLIRQVEGKAYGLTVAHPWKAVGDIVFAITATSLLSIRSPGMARCGVITHINQEIDCAFFLLDPEQKHEILTLHGVSEPVSGIIAPLLPVTSASLDVTGYGAATRGAQGAIAPYTNIGGALRALEVKERRTDNFASVVAPKNTSLTMPGDCGTGWWHNGLLLAMHAAKQTITIPVTDVASVGAGAGAAPKIRHLCSIRSIGPTMSAIKSVFPLFFPHESALAIPGESETKEGAIDGDDLFRLLVGHPDAVVTETRTTQRIGESVPIEEALVGDDLFRVLATLSDALVTETR